LRKGIVQFVDESRLADVVEMDVDSESGDSDRPREKNEEKTNPESESTATEINFEDVQRRVQSELMSQIRHGTNGQLCIVAVVGPWRRAELLRRRPLEAPAPPEKIVEMAATVGSPVSCAAGDAAVAKGTEVHELVMHITDEDQGHAVQLLAFQVGAADTLETLINDSATSDCGSESARSLRSRREARRTTSKIGAKRSIRRKSLGDTQSRLSPLVGDSHLQKSAGPSTVTPQLGQMATPTRWCVAEFFIDGANALPFDEDEMMKAIPAERNAMDLLYERCRTP
jgi:hypothetical protein